MFEMKIWIKIVPDKRNEFEQAINFMLEKQYFKSINFQCEMYQKLENKSDYCYSEKWNSREQFENHTSSNEFRALLGAIKVLGEIIESKLIYFEKEEIINFN